MFIYCCSAGRFGFLIYSSPVRGNIYVLTADSELQLASPPRTYQRAVRVAPQEPVQNLSVFCISVLAQFFCVYLSPDIRFHKFLFPKNCPIPLCLVLHFPSSLILKFLATFGVRFVGRVRLCVEETANIRCRNYTPTQSTECRGCLEHR